jgi:HK97 family phage portal protein
VLPLVTPDGQVFYQLGVDNLAGIEQDAVKVPASEIIHDRFNCLCHPLVGLSPIFACGLAAYNGLKIQGNSAKYFTNMSRPSGILTAPGAIKPETATALKEAWESNYSGDNYGRIAVLGDDLKYEALSLTAEESQMVEQLRLTAEIVCSAFHVPKYKVIGDPPSFNNIEALEQGYYSQCLQVLIEAIELLLDEGLSIPALQGAEFDLDGLLRMDTKTQVETLSAAIKGGLDTPNEARARRNQKPLPGGDSIWLQEQNWPMEVLATRREPPAAGSNPANADGTDPADDNEPLDPTDENADDNADAQKFLTALGAALKKEMELVSYDA